RCELYFFFFFQAEDGIRDRNVTGVQTCALPILITVQRFFFAAIIPAAQRTADSAASVAGSRVCGAAAVSSAAASASASAGADGRSEERRVGKECGSGWARRRGVKKSRTDDKRTG